MRALLLLALATATLPAASDDWTLTRGIYPGQTTHVHTQDGKKHSGGFISTSDTAIVIRLRNGDQSYARDQVQKISVRKGSKRWRNAGVGGAIGAIAMGSLAAATLGNDDGGLVAAVAVFYGIIGAGVGALFPGYDTIYRVPKREGGWWLALWRPFDVFAISAPEAFRRLNYVNEVGRRKTYSPSSSLSSARKSVPILIASAAA